MKERISKIKNNQLKSILQMFLKNLKVKMNNKNYKVKKKKLQNLKTSNGIQSENKMKSMKNIKNSLFRKLRKQKDKM